MVSKGGIFALTGNVGYRLEFLFPELRYLDGLRLVAIDACLHPLLVGVVHDLLQVVRLQGIEDVEEVLARRPFTGRILVREVLRELRVFAELWPQCLY